MAYNIQEAKELVVEAGKKLLETGLIARTWGNVSARISDTQFVITPSGRAYETLTPDDIVVVNKGYGLLSMGNDKVKEGTAYSILKEYIKCANPPSVTLPL